MSGVAWDDPIPLGPEPPNPLPLDALPPVLRDHAASVAASVQVAPDLPVLHIICAVSAAVAGKVEVCVDGAWIRECLPVYGVAVAEPGERKSGAHEPMVSPIRVWQADKARKKGASVRAARDLVDVREGELKSAKLAVMKGDPIKVVEAARTALDEAEADVPFVPAPLAQDVTPEALVRHMAKQRGRVAIFAPEGGPLRILDGRYSEGAARLEEVAQAYDGEPIYVHRVDKEPLHVPRPALTMALCVQPSVLETIRNARSMCGQGLFARISWVVPQSLAGDRVDSSEAPPLDQGAAERYETTIHGLLDWEPDKSDEDKDEDEVLIPARIGLSPEATAVKLDYHYEIESELGGKLLGIRDWASKTVGRAIRIATLFELVDRASNGRLTVEDPISGWAMESAVRMCRALTTHALHVYDAMDRDVERELARYVIRRAKQAKDLANLSERELFRLCDSKPEFQTMDDFRRTLAYLEDRGWVTYEDRKPVGGRPPSPWIRFHPSVSKDIRDKSPLEGMESTSLVPSVPYVPVQPTENDEYERLEREAIQQEAGV